MSKHSNENEQTIRHSRTKEKSKSEKRRNAIRIIAGCLVGLGLVYAIFLFVTTNFLGSNNISTEMAVKYTAADTIKTTGLIVRDEECIKNEYNGVLSYRYFDGDKVQVNGEIADVYNSENDAIAQARIKEIDDRIAYLEDLSSTSTAVNVGLDSVNNQINSKLFSLIDTVNKQKFSSIDAIEDELMTSIYRKQVITGEQGDFAVKIEELKSEKQMYLDSCSDSVGTVKAQSSGYFVSEVDGYENVLDIKKLDEITPKQLKKIKPDDIDKNAYVGKIIKGINWYLLCEISTDEATSIMHDSFDVKIKLPYAVLGDVPAKIISVNPSSDDDKCVLVLQCNYMNNSLSKIRKEAVDVVIKTYQGLKVAKSALHDDFVEKTVEKDDGSKETQKEKVQGVYVKYGSELVFKQVVVLYSGNDYVVCAEQPDEDALFNGKTIALYDEVVVQGSDLFDGKIID